MKQKNNYQHGFIPLLSLLVLGLLSLSIFYIVNKGVQQSQYQSTKAQTSSIPKPTLLPIRLVNGKLITLPRAALTARGDEGTGEHTLGAMADPEEVIRRHQQSDTTKKIDELPESVDLSTVTSSATSGSYADSVNNPPVGNQGKVLSCVSWAIGYYSRGYYAVRDGYYPPGGQTVPPDGSFAPMFLYSQVSGGKNVATSPSSTYDVAIKQGIDTRADYCQGDYDYADLPTVEEKANAAQYKITGWSSLTKSQSTIEATLAGGDPITLLIPIYSEFDYPNLTTCLVDTVSGSSRGNHQVFGYAYDSNGVWIENSWGTGWGCNGHIELSWHFITKYALGVYRMQVGSAATNIIIPTLLQCASSPTPTTQPTPFNGTPTPIPTSTPAPESPTPSVSDTEAPIVFITSPINGSTLLRNSTIILSAGATDNKGVTRVEFYVNNSLKCTGQSSPYTCSWKVPGKQNAQYTIAARAYDGANNSASTSISISTK